MTTNKAYLQRFVLLIAAFGLLNCSQRSKNGQTVLKPPPVNPFAKGYTLNDPTVFYGHELVQIKQTAKVLNVSAATNENLTGRQLNDLSVYTEGGRDELIKDVHALLDQANAKQKEKNQIFSGQLILNQVILDPNNPGEVRVNFLHYRNKGGQHYTMAGRIRDQRAMLTPEISGDTLEVQLACMDNQLTCHNILLRFRDRTNEAIAYGIFRTAPTRMRFFTGSNSNNAAHSRIIEMLKNTSTSNDKRPRLRAAVLETATIVEGVSTFAFFMRFDRGQQKETVLPVFGRLVKGKSSVETKHELLTDQQFVMLKDSPSSVTDASLQQLKSLQLSQNNGRGQLQLSLNFGADQHQAGSIYITIARPQVQLRALQDIQF